LTNENAQNDYYIKLNSCPSSIQSACHKRVNNFNIIEFSKSMRRDTVSLANSWTRRRLASSTSRRLRRPINK